MQIRNNSLIKVEEMYWRCPYKNITQKIAKDSKSYAVIHVVDT